MLRQRQMMMQYQQRMQSQNSNQSATPTQAMISAETPNETPVLPMSMPNPVGLLTAEEMDFMLFGGGKKSESPSPTQLTPAPHSQNWQYQVSMAKMGMKLVDGSEVDMDSEPKTNGHSESV